MRVIGMSDLAPWEVEGPPLTQKQYDDLRDIAVAACLSDRGYMPGGFWHMFAALGVLAHTNLEGAEWAASVLQQVAMSAWDAGDQHDPQGQR